MEASSNLDMWKELCDSHTQGYASPEEQGAEQADTDWQVNMYVTWDNNVSANQI